LRGVGEAELRISQGPNQENGMADGGERLADIAATRRELDALKESHQRQIDDLRREVGEKVKDMKEELRRLSESIQTGMAGISQKLERMIQAPPPAPTPLPQQLYNDAKKSGTPLWVIFVMAVGALFLYLIAHRAGVM
jgi:hypothetical protein